MDEHLIALVSKQAELITRLSALERELDIARGDISAMKSRSETFHKYSVWVGTALVAIAGVFTYAGLNAFATAERSVETARSDFDRHVTTARSDLDKFASNELRAKLESSANGALARELTEFRGNLDNLRDFSEVIRFDRKDGSLVMLVDRLTIAPLDDTERQAKPMLVFDFQQPPAQRGGLAGHFFEEECKKYYPVIRGYTDGTETFQLEMGRFPRALFMAPNQPSPFDEKKTPFTSYTQIDPTGFSCQTVWNTNEHDYLGLAKLAPDSLGEIGKPWTMIRHLRLTTEEAGAAWTPIAAYSRYVRPSDYRIEHGGFEVVAPTGGPAGFHTNEDSPSGLQKLVAELRRR